MIILGLDPGFARCGFGVIEMRKNDPHYIAHGCIETKKNETFESRLVAIGEAVNDLIIRFKPDRIAIEKIFFTKNIKTAIQVSHARGAILFVCGNAKIPIIERTPSEVKMGLTGYGSADKRQMQLMIKLQLKLKEVPKPDDAADALAIAICGV